jgi:hypothetical protein
MTLSNSHTFSSENKFSTLLNQVVLLLLGSPPVLGVVRVVGAQQTESRILIGGASHGFA